MAQWYLSRNGQPKKTFSSWGFVNLHRKLVSQGADVVSFEAEGALIDADPILGFEDQIKIYKDSDLWFSGVVSKVPVKGGAAEETQTFEVSGPWYYFENQIFIQTYIGYVSNAYSLTPPPSASWLSTDKSVNEGGTYVGTDNLNHVFPSSLFHAMPNQTGPILVRASDGAIFGQIPSSHVFLNSWIYDAYGKIQPITQTVFGAAYTTGITMHTGQQITQALQNAQAAQTAVLGAPVFQMGSVTLPTGPVTSQAQANSLWVSATVAPAIPAVVAEQRDITVAEVIRNQLRWSPDAVCWFDYTQSPPMFHIGVRGGMDVLLIPSFGPTSIELTPGGGGNLPSETIPITSGMEISEVSINPRYDLLVPFVRITYEQVNKYGGTSFTSKIIDQYPTSAPLYGFGAMVSTIDLRGVSTGASVDITSSQIPAMTDGTAYYGPSGPASTDPYTWWTTRKEWPLMNASDVIVDQITTNARAPENGIDPGLVPYELTSGQLAPWLGGASSREQVTATLYYHTKNGQQFVKPLSTTLQATGVNSGTYYNQADIVYGEPVPVGLAEFLFSSVGVLQYDGQLTISEDECSGLVGLSTVLNLSPNWEAMNAMVVQIDENIDQGITQVSFGPKKNLGVSDLVELVRVIRSRILTSSFKDTYGATTGSVALGTQTSVAQADVTNPLAKIIAVSQVNDPIAAKTSNPLDPTILSGSFDSVNGKITLAGRDAQSGLPLGDGVISLKLGDLVKNSSLNA